MLQKLILKQSALDDLDLPVKTVAGHLGNISFKDYHDGNIKLLLLNLFKMNWC